MKYCKDCTHYTIDSNGHWVIDKHQCFNPIGNQLDIVTKEQVYPSISCYTMREEGHLCGVDATLFEAVEGYEEDE